MAEELTQFRNKVAFALLFINLCFFVFAVTLKAYGDELPGAVMHIPITILVNKTLNRLKLFLQWYRTESRRFQKIEQNLRVLGQPTTSKNGKRMNSKLVVSQKKFLFLLMNLIVLIPPRVSILYSDRPTIIRINHKYISYKLY